MLRTRQTARMPTAPGVKAPRPLLSALVSPKVNHVPTANLLGLNEKESPNLLEFGPTKDGLRMREEELRGLFNTGNNKTNTRKRKTRKSNARKQNARKSNMRK